MTLIPASVSRPVLAGLIAFHILITVSYTHLDVYKRKAWLWSFVGGAPKINHFSDRSQMPAVTPEAEAMSKALRKAGFNFVGPTICYAFMQATGMVMDHTTDCDRYAQLKGS